MLPVVRMRAHYKVINEVIPAISKIKQNAFNRLLKEIVEHEKEEDKKPKNPINSKKFKLQSKLK